MGTSKTPFGFVFGRQVSDFGTVFGRQVSYCSPPDYHPDKERDVYAPLGLCVKNTFLTVEEDEQEPTGTAAWRSQSAPARCAQNGPDMRKLDGGCCSSEEQVRGDAMRKTKSEKQHKRIGRKSLTQPGPLPVGQVSLAQPGPMLLGRTTKRDSNVKFCQAI